MNKLWLIIKREYLVRVRKKTFIIATLLTPLAIMAIYMVPILIFQFSGGQEKIVFKDESGIFENIPSSERGNSRVHFTPFKGDLETIRKTYREEDYVGVLHIPKFKSIYNDLTVRYYSGKQISVSTKEFIEGKITRRIRDYKMEMAGLSQNQLDSLQTSVQLEQTKEKINAQGEIEEEKTKASAGLATAIGFGMAFFMYIVIFLYGMMVMRSVMEEKVNRIVEVIISSVRPFQLMLGKIIGVSGVGLTQMVIWIVALLLFQMIAAPLLIGSGAMPDPGTTGVTVEQTEEGLAMVQSIMTDIANQNWSFMIPVIIFFFLGGYFIYASLFGAVGSAIGDDYGEGQSLTIPIVIPVILALFIAMSIVDNPHSGIAVFGSIFPLFSPIVMPARLAFDPPLWEVIASMAVLAASVIFFVWLSGRIYRVGIFMYGKKVTLREVWKWLFYKG